MGGCGHQVVVIFDLWYAMSSLYCFLEFFFFDLGEKSSSCRKVKQIC